MRWPVLALAAAASLPALPARAADTLRVVFRDTVTNVDPYFNQLRTGVVISHQAWDGLVYRDPDTFEAKPLLATSWKLIDDSTWEIKLRPNVKWSDGNAFVPEDVVDSLMWFINPDAKLTNAGNWEWIEKVEKTGANTVRLYNKRPTPHALARLTAGSDIWPAHVTTKLADRKDFGRAPIGTGPYKLENWDRGNEMVFSVNENYWGEAPIEPSVETNPFRLIVDRFAFSSSSSSPFSSSRKRSARSRNLGSM